MAKTMSASTVTPPSAESVALSAHAVAGKKRGLPPVHEWDPPYCGDLDIRIRRDGTWEYLGSRIERPGLVRLFSTILRKEGEKYFLVTPVEKVGITVDDKPFVAVDFEVEETEAGAALRFETNVGDTLVAGPDHPLRIERDPETGEPAPYVLVRSDLEALIDRKSFYRLVEIGKRHEGWFGLWSAGEFFPVIPEAELPD
jgi:hypothetical protein